MKYKVKQGDDIASIAYRFNILPETIWNDPANARLKEKRRDPEILFPGDVLEFRKNETKEIPISTEKRHRFRVKGQFLWLQIQFLDSEQEPRVSVSYVLTIDGAHRNGQTDETGSLSERIPTNAKHGKLRLETGEEYELQLGTLDPIDTISGVQKRLQNLGYDCGDDNYGDLGEGTKSALGRYQADHGLQETMEIDEDTRNHLRDTHLGT